MRKRSGFAGSAVGLSLMLIGEACPGQVQATGGDEVRVRITGSDNAILERDTGESWVDACRAPCDRLVPANGSYRITGAGIRDSDPFTLRAHGGGSEMLRVQSSSQTGFVGGVALSGVGGVALLFGLGMTLFGTTKSCSSVDGSTTNGCSLSNPALLGAGIGVSAAGLVSIVSGIVLMAINGKSSVFETVVPASSGNSASTSRDLFLVVPAPHWQADERTRVGGAAIFSSPLATMPF